MFSTRVSLWTWTFYVPDTIEWHEKLNTNTMLYSHSPTSSWALHRTMYTPGMQVLHTHAERSEDNLLLFYVGSQDWMWVIWLRGEHLYQLNHFACLVTLSMIKMCSLGKATLTNRSGTWHNQATLAEGLRWLGHRAMDFVYTFSFSFYNSQSYYCHPHFTDKMMKAEWTEVSIQG